ncbi:MAG: GNAT family N-acetyltransferase [Planctomycetes bacterium]|nr:GNAT family N-acetyltransferase [Planctomycetota bacterium]
MEFRLLNPIDYPDWDGLLLRSNNQSFFHTAGWAIVLEKTYRFKPLYFALDKGDQLVLLMPMMEIVSPLTGRRGVSLPFTDYCTPFSPDRSLLPWVMQSALEFAETRKWRYIEWRAGEYFMETTSPYEAFYTHDIDLAKSEPGLFSALSDSCRRNIKKSIKEGVSIKAERSFGSIKSFYHLNCITRKRHGLPPQPFEFFKNIHEYVISKGNGIVVSAHYEGNLIAASIYFHFGSKAIFKYGSSDIGYQRLRPNNLVMWETIRWFKNHGFASMNLGRTEHDNPGLLQYKRSWGAKESALNYYRYDISKKEYVARHSDVNKLYKWLFTRTPVSILRAIGKLSYRHLA